MAKIVPAQSIIDDARNKRLTYPKFSFPDDLGAHAIILAFKEYSYEESIGTNQSVTEIPNGAVVLPIPTNLIDTYNVNVNQTALDIGGAARASAYSAGKTLMGSDNGESFGTKSAKAVNNIFKDLSGFNLDSVKQNMADIAVVGAQMARGAVKDLIGTSSFSAGTGTVVNPHMAVVFDGMALKTHNFTWTLAPKSDAESRKLNEIQNYIRRNILPSFNTGKNNDPKGAVGRFASRSVFKYPNVVDIFFVGIDQSYFYYFKRCMVNSFALNYSPTGNNTFLKGGRPAFVQLDMQLIETEVFASNDIPKEGT